MCSVKAFHFEPSQVRNVPINKELTYKQWKEIVVAIQLFCYIVVQNQDKYTLSRPRVIFASDELILSIRHTFSEKIF